MTWEKIDTDNRGWINLRELRNPFTRREQIKKWNKWACRESSHRKSRPRDEICTNLLFIVRRFFLCRCPEILRNIYVLINRKTKKKKWWHIWQNNKNQTVTSKEKRQKFYKYMLLFLLLIYFLGHLNILRILLCIIFIMYVS